MKNTHLKNAIISGVLAVFSGTVLFGASAAFGVNDPTYSPPGNVVSPTFNGITVTGNIANGTVDDANVVTVNDKLNIAGEIATGAVADAHPVTIADPEGLTVYKNIVMGVLGDPVETLTINGNTNLKGNVSIDGTASIVGNLLNSLTIGLPGVGNSRSLTVTGDSTVNGRSTVGGDLSLTGSVITNFVVGSAVAFASNKSLTVNGNTILGVASQAPANTTTINGASTLNGTLDVRGDISNGAQVGTPVTIRDPLTVTGELTANAPAVIGQSTIGGNLSLSGNMLNDLIIGIDSAGKRRSLTVTGNATIGVAGVAPIDNLTVNGTSTVNGDSTLNGTLGVTGNVTNGTAADGNPFTIADSLFVNGNTTIGANDNKKYLTVNGNTTFGVVDGNDSFLVNANANLNGDTNQILGNTYIDNADINGELRVLGSVQLPFQQVTSAFSFNAGTGLRSNSVLCPEHTRLISCDLLISSGHSLIRGTNIAPFAAMSSIDGVDENNPDFWVQLGIAFTRTCFWSYQQTAIGAVSGVAYATCL